MRKMIFISALALSTASLPVALHAQAAATPPAADAAPAGPFSMTTEQKGQYDGWPADLKAKYDAWPSAQQEYFWSLNADQQKGWWAMNDTQRGQVYAMTPDQRAQIWPSIVAQVQGRASASASASATGSTPPAPTADPSSAMASNSAAAPAPMQGSDSGMSGTAMANNGQYASNTDATPKKYPVCSRTVTDSCRNRNGV